MLAIRRNVVLAPFTTMRVGGPARYFVEVYNEKDALEAVRLAKENSWPIFILGGGSNIIISDEGFPGLVIHNKIAGFKSVFKGNKVRVRVGAGEIWDDFVRRVVELNWQGAENLSGVPGTVGGAPVQNVGCYGQSVSEIITAVRAIDIPASKIKIFDRESCRFGYRDSIFRSSSYGRFFITEVEFELIPEGSLRVLSYPDLEKYFSQRHANPSLKEVRQAVLEIRGAKGMVLMPEYDRFLSVGSFFKNPLVKAADFLRISAKIDSRGTKWFWEQEDGTVKIAAAKLVEESGFSRGYREGEVGISPKHSLAIINFGQATASEIMSFAAKIKSAVQKKFGIELEYEAQFIGREKF
jgi:UDP-N-acetylmuramate dehydrogenase